MAWNYNSNGLTADNVRRHNELFGGGHELTMNSESSHSTSSSGSTVSSKFSWPEVVPTPVYKERIQLFSKTGHGWLRAISKSCLDTKGRRRDKSSVFLWGGDTNGRGVVAVVLLPDSGETLCVAYRENGTLYLEECSMQRGSVKVKSANCIFVPHIGTDMSKQCTIRFQAYTKPDMYLGATIDGCAQLCWQIPITAGSSFFANPQTMFYLYNTGSGARADASYREYAFGYNRETRV